MGTVFGRFEEEGWGRLSTCGLGSLHIYLERSVRFG